MTVEVHWLRLLLIHILLVSGGGTLVHMLLGKAVPLVTNPLILTSTFLAYLLVFHCPGDVFAPVVRSPATRQLWRAVAAIHIALSAVGGVNDAYSVNPGLPAWSSILFGVLGGVGGSLTVEITNSLLLHPTVYTQPRNGPSPGAINALWFSALYIALRSTPLLHAVNFVTGGHWKAPSVETARAVTVAVSLALTFAEVSLPALTASLLKSVPGFKSTLIPLALETEKASDVPAAHMDGSTAAAHGMGMGSTQPTWPMADGIFGYEYDPYEDYDMDVVFVAGDEEGEGEGEEAPSATTPARGKSPTPPSTVRSRARGGSAAKGSAKRK